MDAISRIITGIYSAAGWVLMAGITLSLTVCAINFIIKKPLSAVFLVVYFVLVMGTCYGYFFLILKLTEEGAVRVILIFSIFPMFGFSVKFYEKFLELFMPKTYIEINKKE